MKRQMHDADGIINELHRPDIETDLDYDSDFDRRYDAKFGEPSMDVFIGDEFDKYMKEVIAFE